MASEIGLVGLAVMGQNLALNIAEKGFKISVYNRSYDKTEAAVARAAKEGLSDNLKGFEDMGQFVQSLQKPRRVIILVQAGAPVDATIEGLTKYMETGDIIIDGGNEWYENTERRQKMCAEKGLIMMGMGVSGGEEGARNGPSLMPGGAKEGYAHLERIVTKVAAQVNDGACVTYIGPGGSGNFVKMVHNGIEYGDMQLISECYDILKTVGGLSNEELAATFAAWNKTELDSFLIEITAKIFELKDDQEGKEGHLVDKILDKTGMKGTGKWTVQMAADLSIAAPVIASSLDARFLSGMKEKRVEASQFFAGLGLGAPTAKLDGDKAAFIEDVKAAMYCAKICSYAQGMALIKAKSDSMGWDINLGGLARIWKGGCIIRAGFLDRIRAAFVSNPALANLLVDPSFGKDLVERHAAWRRVVQRGIGAGIGMPAMTSALAYFDAYRRASLPANLVQAQRDYFGSHQFERIDMPGSFHAIWSDSQSKDSITTSVYKA